MRPVPRFGHGLVGGSEFINHSVVRWAGDLDIYFTRSRPYRKNDQATIESKNNHLVRRYAYLLTATTPAKSARSWAVSGTRSTSSSTPLDPHPQAHRMGHR